MEASFSPQELAAKVKLCDANGDIRKPWFVEYYAFNPQAQDYQRNRIYKGLNDHPTVSHRCKAGKALVANAMAGIPLKRKQRLASCARKVNANLPSRNISNRYLMKISRI